MLRKTTIALSSTCAQGIGASSSSSTTSRRRRPTEPCNRTHRTPAHLQCRTYAMVADGPSRDAPHENIPWPEVTSANAIPTPYQIFNQRKGSPYSKRRFYELVKIYHPDRHSVSSCYHDDIPVATKLERYRLIVAANNLLSDPVKRSAYDTYGAGWHGTPSALYPGEAAAPNGSWASPHTGRGWDGGPGGPANNATWEDWEKWYNRDEKQEPIYFSNTTFLVLIALFIGVGYMGQTRRLDNFSLSLTRQIDALHNDMSKELVRRRKEASMYGDRDERIQEFLKARDPVSYGVTDPREEQIRKVLPAPEICSSNDIESRATDIYHSAEEREKKGES